jgi:DNA-binding transcriptional regulator YiaG
MRVIALRLIEKRCHLTGDEIRFLRKYLGMTGDQFCRLLHVDRTTLSKWENNNDPIGPQSDRLIRAVVMALGEGLKEKLEETVRHFATIGDCCHPSRIRVNPQTLAPQNA